MNSHRLSSITSILSQQQHARPLADYWLLGTVLVQAHSSMENSSSSRSSSAISSINAAATTMTSSHPHIHASQPLIETAVLQGAVMHHSRDRSAAKAIRVLRERNAFFQAEIHAKPLLISEALEKGLTKLHFHL